MRFYNSAHIDVRAGLVLRGGGFKMISLTVRYGLIDLRERGLCLVDTGVGPELTQGPRTSALRLYSAMLRPKLILDQAPEAVLRAMGATTADVRLIIVTHFHADHVSSLQSFPQAEIIACGEATSRVAAMSSTEAVRHGIFKELIPQDIARRLRPLQGLPRQPTGTALGDGYDLFADGSYLAVPLPGHALGHFGVLWRDAQGPVIYATDAAWTAAALIDDRTPWLASAVVFNDSDAGRRSAALLRQFHREGGRIHLCHDVEDAPS